MHSEGKDIPANKITNQTNELDWSCRKINIPESIPCEKKYTNVH
jgi:hypothetical protein